MKNVILIEWPTHRVNALLSTRRSFKKNAFISIGDLIEIYLLTFWYLSIYSFLRLPSLGDNVSVVHRRLESCSDLLGDVT